jgi:hypothetical protein
VSAALLEANPLLAMDALKRSIAKNFRDLSVDGQPLKSGAKMEFKVV